MTPEEHAAVESAFIAGFRHAPNTLGFLRLAGIPLELHRPERPGLKLMPMEGEEHRYGRTGGERSPCKLSLVTQIEGVAVPF